MTTPIKNAKLEAIKQTTAAGPHTGDITWWSFEDVEVEAPSFKKAWTDAGLPPGALPSDPTPMRLLKRASQEALVGLTGQDGDGRDDTHLLRWVGQTEGKSTFALVREVRAAHGATITDVENTYVTEARVAVDDDSGQFLTDKPEHPIVKAIASAYDRMTGKLMAREVRSAIITAIKGFSGVLLRDAGGVYWVPAKHAEKVRSLQAIIQGCGHSTFDVLPVHDSAEGNATLAHAAQQGLSQQLAALAAEMTAWTEAGKARKGTLEARLVEYAEIRDRALLYAEVLSAKVDDIAAGVVTLTEQAQALLDGKGEEAATAAEAAPASA